MIHRPSTIDGCRRSGIADRVRFLHIALGSTNELAYQLILARDLSFLVVDTYESLAAGTLEIQRMLGSLILKIRAEERV